MERKYIILIIIAATVVALLIIIVPTTVVLLDVDTCIITLHDLFEKQPLILHRYENIFILPEKGKIHLTTGQSIRLVCSGNNNGLTFNNDSEVEISCVANNTFTVILDNSEHSFDNITCNKTPETILIETGKSCGNYFTELEIGFNTSLGVVPLITTCFDEVKKDSLYSKYTLSQALKYSQKYEKRPPNFQGGIYYKDLKPDDRYTKKTQAAWFKKILGLSKYIIIENSDYFLSKGHLTPFSHFSYYAQKTATMYYVNVAPQWQVFNGGNWKDLEEDTIDFAYNRSADLIVYTGIYGNAQLNSSTNQLVDLHMYKIDDTIPVLTVPEVFWKVLYDPRLKLAIVFVGHNNPYEMNINSKLLCSNICSQIQGLKWQAYSVSRGYSYCCDYYDFKNVVHYLPELIVYGILT